MNDPIPTDILGPGDCCPKCGSGEIEFLGIAVRDYLAWKCFGAECGYMWKTPLFEKDYE